MRRRPAVVVVHTIRARVIRGPREDGRWYWRAEQRAHGSTSTVWTGWATPDEVGRVLAERVSSGRVAVPRATIQVRTVYDLLSYWLGAREDREDLAPRTVEHNRATSKRILAQLRHVQVSRVDRRTLEAYRDTRLRAGWAPGSVLLDLRTLRQAWKWGREIGVVSGDLPSVPVRLPQRAYHTPTADDIARVLEALVELGPEWAWRAVLLWSATGCRRGEVGALQWQDFDGESHTLSVDGKTGPRLVPLHPTVSVDVASWRPEPALPDAWLLGVAPGTVRAGIAKYLRRACTAAGVEHLTVQSIRRHVVDRLYRGRVDVGTAAALLGHSPETALRHYRRATEADLRSAVEVAGLGVVQRDNVLPMTRSGETRTPSAHNRRRK